MAKLSASKALENYKLKQISNLASALQDSTKASRAKRNAISFKEDDEDKPPKPSEILKEYQARIEIEEIQEQERERKETGMSRGEFKDYEDTVANQRALFKTKSKEKRTETRTIDSDGRAAARKEAEAIADKVEAGRVAEEAETAIRDKIEKGEGGFIQSQIEGIYPQGQTTFSKHSDINILMDPLDAGDRKQQKSFFTIDDILFMVKNGEFEKAGFTEASIASRLNVENGESTNTIDELQQFMFEFLLTPHGQNIANSQKMTYKSEQEKRLDMLDMLIMQKDGFTMDEFQGPKENN